jgi:hypothetical protein
MYRYTERNIERLRDEVQKLLKKPVLTLPCKMPRHRFMHVIRRQLALMHHLSRKARTARYLERCALRGTSFQ